MYSLDAESFFDANDDGLGDLQGVTEKLNYLAALGVTCIWLQPFFPSPNRDNGYDVMDYFGVDKRLGDLGYFSELIDRANDLGIRVIIDLVVNHTSKEHPWFKAARSDRRSRYRDYYVWADEPHPFDESQLTFVGEEDTMWTYDRKAGQYYLHRFYKEQPDLNISNPDVRAEILRIIGFWLKMGVSGFRIDAASLLIEPYGLEDAEKIDLAPFLEEMRQYISLRKGDAILIGEANVPPSEMKTFMQRGRKMHMLFNFHLNMQLFLSLARQNASTLYKGLREQPEIPPGNKMLNFLRNHDELTLDQLTEEEQQEIFAAFAPQKSMQIYGHGIRRRLASMFNNDQQRMELAFSLMFSMPGVPMIRYGDEIGMGDNLRLQGRSSVRTPMQWADTSHGGFSNAADVKHKPVSKSPYSPKEVNVVSASSDPDSLLSWMKRLITARKQCGVIGDYATTTIKINDDRLFVHHYNRSSDVSVLFIHNLSGDDVAISRKKIKELSANKYELFGDGETRVSGDKLTIRRYGYIWLKTMVH